MHQGKLQLSENPFGKVEPDIVIEVTVNLNTKTPGGTSGFSTNSNAINRWDTDQCSYMKNNCEGNDFLNENFILSGKGQDSVINKTDPSYDNNCDNNLNKTTSGGNIAGSEEDNNILFDELFRIWFFPIQDRLTIIFVLDLAVSADGFEPEKPSPMVKNTSGIRSNKYPSACACQYETTINCGGSNFSEIPSYIDRNVQVLMMKNNGISKLTAEQFDSYKKLSVLLLDHNGIKDIPARVFSNMKLITLYVYLRREGFTSNRGIGALISIGLLSLANNHLVKIKVGTFDGLQNTLKILFLNNNELKSIEAPVFYGFENLHEFHLDHNDIQKINRETLSSLTLLIGLFLDYNEIESIEAESFRKLGRLKELYLESIVIDDISIQLFQPLKDLNRIHFKKFRYCSYVPFVRVCEPRSNGLSSTQHLLVKPVLRISIWIVATLTCIGNTVVLLGRTFFPSNGEETSQISLLFIKNLSAADLLMGIYLFVVALKDMDFRDTYNANAHLWMSSFTCTLCGILAMTSSEVSVLTLSFMSIERHSRIVSPLTGFQISIKRTYVIIFIIWIVGLTVAITPVIIWSFADPVYKFYGSNGFCFPLHMVDPFKMGWQYSAFVFLGINLIGVLIISYSYVSMYVNIQSTRSHAHCKKVDMELAKRFFFIVMTDCLCWIPIIVLKIIALTETDIPQDLYAWVVVFILPVNSAMNPIIYSISSKAFWNKIRDLVESKQIPEMLMRDLVK
ncbi:Relaxin receptor 2 [Nymphon striatum]|nr:Relaxin receptor 2 [Nymphon striatum]